MIRIIVVEDEYEHQQYFKSIMHNCADFKLLGMYSLGKLGIKEIVALKPDVVIMDIGLPDISGIDCIRQLKLMPECGAIKFMVCTVFDNDENVFKALQAGATSYFVKRSQAYKIRDAIYDVMRGDMPMSSSIATKILNQFQTKIDEDKRKLEHKNALHETLNDRELEILKLLSRGMTNLKITEQLNLTIGRLKWTIKNIYKVLHAKNRVEASSKYLGTS